MTAQPEFINDWHRLMDQIGDQHRPILQSTLPTSSLGFLLEAYITDCRQRLTQLYTSRDAVEFKNRYHSIKQQEDFAESFLHFVKSLKTQS